MRIHLHSGQRLPRLAGASGRAFAANQRLARAEIAAEYPTVRNQTKSSLEAFLNDVEQARQKGWAIDVNGLVHGVTSIAAPVVDPRSDEHTSELPSLMRIPSAVFCLKTKNHDTPSTLLRY